MSPNYSSARMQWILEMYDFEGNMNGAKMLNNNNKFIDTYIAS